MNETTGTTTVSAGADPESKAPYRVLARKYRPKDFTDLIGQEPKAFFATFSEYFAALDQSPPAVNVIA